MFFDDTIIKTFYVQNQPLVESPDTRNLIGALMESVLKDEDMMFHIQKDIISNFGKPEVHKFNRSVESGRYAPGYPEVEVKINIRSNQKIIDALVDKFGNYDYVILEGKVGKLTDYDWVINHYYLIDQTTFDLDGNFLLNFYHEIDEINYDWVIVDANLATGVDELGDPYPPGTYHISLKEPPATSYTDRNYHITEVLPDKPEGLYYVIKYKYSYLDAGGEMVTKYGYFYHLASSTEYANLTLPPFDFDQSVQCTDFDDSPPVIPTQSGNSCWDKTLDEAGNPGSLVYFDGKHFLYTIGGKGFRTASEDGDRTDKPAWRNIGLMTSSDGGDTFVRYGTSAILSESLAFPTNQEEEGIFSVIARVEGGTKVVLYMSLMTSTAPGAVKSDIYTMESTDGYNFTNLTKIIDHSEFTGASAGAEIGPVGLFGSYIYLFVKEWAYTDYTVVKYNMSTSTWVRVGNYNRATCGSNYIELSDGRKYLHTCVGNPIPPGEGWYPSYASWVRGLNATGDPSITDWMYHEFPNLGTHSMYYCDVTERWFWFHQYYYKNSEGNMIGSHLYMRHWDADNTRFPVLSDWGDPIGIKAADCELVVPAYPDFENPPVDPPPPPPPDPPPVGENLDARPFPPVPIRKRNKDYNDYEGMTPEEEEVATEAALEIDHMMRKVAIETKKLIREVMTSPSVEGEENKIDNLYVTFATRIWDPSQGAREYLFKFFSTLCAYQHLVDSDYIPPTPDAGDPYFDDSLPDGEDFDINYLKKYLKKNYIKLQTVDEEYLYYFTYETLISKFTSVANLDLIGNEDRKKIYYYDVQKFDDSNKLLKEYYMSSGSTILEVGYLLSIPEHVEKYLNFEPVPRDTPQVPDDHPGRELFRCSRRINYDGVIYDELGDPTTEEDLVVEKTYGRLDIGGGEYRVQIHGKPVEHFPQHVVYYHITEEGLYEIKVYAPMGLAYVEDADTQYSDFVGFNSWSPNELTVPFIYAVVLPMNNHSATDAFLSSMHLSVYVADVTVVKKPWWQIVLQIVAIIISAWMGGVGGAIVSVLIQEFAKQLLGNMLHSLLGDNAKWAMLVASVIMIVLSRGAQGFNFASMTAANIVSLVSQFTQILSGIVINIKQDSLENLVEEQNLLAKQQAREQAELESQVERSALDTGLLVDLLTERSETTIIPTSPENYFTMVENFTELGLSTIDVSSSIENNFVDPMATL